MNVELQKLEVQRLGANRITSNLTGVHFVEDGDQVVLQSNPALLRREFELSGAFLAFEKAGPRPRFTSIPSKLKCGIVTCGGLCPGLNDVIRAVVLEPVPQLRVPERLRLSLRLRGADLPLRPRPRAS